MNLPTDLPLHEFAIALAIGALVGVEREQKKRVGQAGPVGLRTFVLIAEAGAVAAWLARQLEAPGIFVGAGLAVGAVVLAGCWIEARARPEALGLTTEVAALVVYLLGGLVLFGFAELAVALAIGTSATLAFKEPLHGLVERLGKDDLQAGLKLLIATFIVLPVLPNRAIDPWGALNPYAMWWLVILISGLSLAGYAATRALGPERGLAITGLAGGLVSSTAVTLSFARRSREHAHGAPVDALAAGLLLAWAVMFARVGIEVAVVHRPLLEPLFVPLTAMGALALALVLLLHLRRRDTGAAGAPAVRVKNPFSLTASLRFALFFLAVRLGVELVQRELPGSGLYAVAALAGLTDVDAITLSMAQFARDGGDPDLAAGSIATAAMTNTLVKCGLAATLGSHALRARVLAATGVVVVGGIGAMIWG